MFIIMGNATIHKTSEVHKATRDHGHTPFFLPPYSPFLNPIEERWSKIKGEVRKTPVGKNEILADKIEEAADKIISCVNRKIDEVRIF